MSRSVEGHREDSQRSIWPKKAVVRFPLLALSIVLLLSSHARADTLFTQADATRLHSLAEKLAVSATDVTQSMTVSEYPTRECLGGIHDAALYLDLSVMTASRIVSVAAAMRDKVDEFVALAALGDHLKSTRIAMANSRQAVNGYVGLCASSAVVNVKGQAILNIISEIEPVISSVSDKVDQTLRQVRQEFSTTTPAEGHSK